MDVGGEGGRAISWLLPFSGGETVAAGPWGLAVPVGRSGSAGVAFSGTGLAAAFRMSSSPPLSVPPQVHEPHLQGVGDV